MLFLNSDAKIGKKRIVTKYKFVIIPIICIY